MPFVIRFPSVCYFQYGRYIRSALRQEKALSAIADLLTNEHERVVKAASGALRNLAVDARNKELIGKEMDSFPQHLVQCL